jgi:hypothetical protein
MGSLYFATILAARGLNFFLTGTPRWQAAQLVQPFMVVIFAMASGATTKAMRAVSRAMRRMDAPLD